MRYGAGASRRSDETGNELERDRDFCADLGSVDKIALLG